MSANLSKKSEKSLIFLIWKQRRIINGFARQIKSLLAEKREFEKLQHDLLKVKNESEGRESGYKEVYKRWLGELNETTEKCREQAKEIAYLKGRLKSQKEREVSNA